MVIATLYLLVLLMTLSNLEEFSAARRFLRSASFLLRIKHPPNDYSAVAVKLSLVPLAERRRMLCVKFLKGLLSSQVDSSDLLSLLNFKVKTVLVLLFMSLYIREII